MALNSTGFVCRFFLSILVFATSQVHHSIGLSESFRLVVKISAYDQMPANGEASKLVAFSAFEGGLDLDVASLTVSHLDHVPRMAALAHPHP